MRENHSLQKPQAQRLSDTPEYTSWKGIKRRTSNPNFKHYYNYGGRGIKVCDRWENSFKAFLEDMGERPSPDHSIDRIDTNGDYTPENCRWAIRSIQNHNQRIRVTNHSGFRGVSWDSRGRKWVSNIWKDRVRLYLGAFDEPELAAITYDAAAIQLYGDNANTNLLGATA